MTEIKPNGKNVINVHIEDELRGAYLDYAMSVIVGRALPDARDGLKPVHRRVLYAMHDLGNTHNRAYKKSARVVGDVIGKYHPHGDVAVYDAIVRMAQSFSLRYPLVDGQGNFGSIDGDAPAAMRYTEVRMAKLTEDLLADLECDTVDFGPNYDESLSEPLVLPSRVPNLLINGSSGIAVGMATNIPPHNLSEIISATVALIDQPQLKVDDLFQYVKGPDFPTGGYICGAAGIREAYRTGRGSITLRAKLEIETWKGDRERIIVQELPYQVNKARLIEKIADLVRDKKIEGISDLRDESDRTGMRMVIELKRGENSSVVLNKLYKLTSLQDNFGINLLAIHQQQPRTFNLKDLIMAFIDHRKDVVIRRTLFELKKAQERSHLLEGLKKAVENIDELIAMIKAAASSEQAKVSLKAHFALSDLQAQAILEMRLARLTGLEREKIVQELATILQQIVGLNALLESEALVFALIKKELLLVKAAYGDARRTEILTGDSSEFTEFDDEDLISDTDALVSITHAGYVKRADPGQFRSQHRGGRGIRAVNLGDEDFVTAIYRCTTLSYLLCFTNQGRLYSLKVYKLPEVSRVAKGKAIVNLVSLNPGEQVKAILPVKEFSENEYIFMVTRAGIVKRTALSEFKHVRAAGLNAISTDDGDELVSARLTQGNNHIFLCTQEGMSIRFDENDARVMGRTARGVIGINLGDGDTVVSMEVLDQAAGSDYEILTVTKNGYGKRTPVSEYRLQSRGGTGIINMKTTEKNGFMLGSRQVVKKDDVILVTNKGQIIRLKVGEISEQGRYTHGVRLITLSGSEQLVSFECMVDYSHTPDDPNGTEATDDGAGTSSVDDDEDDGGGDGGGGL